MGANFEVDEKAIIEAENIPHECKTYLSHHIRNSLQSIMAVAMMRLKDKPEVCDAIRNHVQHISNDMSRIGV